MDGFERKQETNAGRGMAGKIDALGWGVFFIWIGIAFLADVGWSVGILGVGLIALGSQAARKYAGLPMEFIGVGMGLAMTAWAAWDLLGLRVGIRDVPGGFVPVLFIVLGATLVYIALRRRPPR